MTHFTQSEAIVLAINAGMYHDDQDPLPEAVTALVNAAALAGKGTK